MPCAQGPCAQDSSAQDACTQATTSYYKHGDHCKGEHYRHVRAVPVHVLSLSLPLVFSFFLQLLLSLQLIIVPCVDLIGSRWGCCTDTQRNFRPNLFAAQRTATSCSEGHCNTQQQVIFNVSSTACQQRQVSTTMNNALQQMPTTSKFYRTILPHQYTELHHIVAPDPLAVGVDDQHMVAGVDDDVCETRKRTTSLDAPNSKRRQLADTSADTITRYVMSWM